MTTNPDNEPAWCSECNAPTDYPGAPCPVDHDLDEDED